MVCIAVLCVGQGSQETDTGVHLDEAGWEGDGALPSTLQLLMGVQSMGQRRANPKKSAQIPTMGCGCSKLIVSDLLFFHCARAGIARAAFNPS